MLDITDVNAGYGKLPVLFDIDISIRRGERVAVVGGNGSGKSTLLKVIVGLIQPSAGDVRYRGEAVAGMPTHRRVRAGMAMVPGERALFRGLTVKHNIHLGGVWLPKAEVASRYEQTILRIFPEIANFQKRLAGDVSGGQQQMCAVARALMAGPELLMIDELSMGLAPVVVDRLAEALDEVSALGTTIIWVDQKVAQALAFTDRAYVLAEGRIVLSGKSQELVNDPAFVTRYVGLS